MSKSKEEYLKILTSGVVEVRRGKEVREELQGLTVQAFLERMIEQAHQREVTRVMVHSKSENKLAIEADEAAPHFVTFRISGTSIDGDWSLPVTISLDSSLATLSLLFHFVGGARGSFDAAALKSIRHNVSRVISENE